MQLLRFLMVGVFNTIFGYSIIFTSMYIFEVSPEISNFVGYSISLTCSYILHKKYTFESTQSFTGEVPKFIFIFMVSYSINLFVLIILIHKFSVHEGLSQLLAGAAYVGTSYVANKYYVFKESNIG